MREMTIRQTQEWWSLASVFRERDEKSHLSGWMWTGSGGEQKSLSETQIWRCEKVPLCSSDCTCSWKFSGLLHMVLAKQPQVWKPFTKSLPTYSRTDPLYCTALKVTPQLRHSSTSCLMQIRPRFFPLFIFLMTETGQLEKHNHTC